MKNYTDKMKDQYKDILKFVKSFIKDNATNLDLAHIPVKHFCVDFRSQILQIKLSQFRKGEDVEDPWAQSDLQIAKFTQHIVTKYGKDIEFQQSTRNLIDELFERKTKFNYTLQLIFFLVAYVLPLYLEIFHAGEDENYRFICLVICIVPICFFTLHAMLQINDLGPSYFWDFYNMAEIIQCLLFFVYFALRKNDLSAYLPENLEMGEGLRRLQTNDTDPMVYAATPMLISEAPEEEIDNSLFVSLFTYSSFQIVLLLLAFLKTTEFVHVYEPFFMLISVIKHCFNRILPFALLFYVWIIVLSLVNRMLGVSVGNDEEPEMIRGFTHSYLNSYFTATGDTNNPDYSFWEQYSSDNNFSVSLMIFIVQIFWFINQFTCFIFMLNFLVAHIA